MSEITLLKNEFVTVIYNYEYKNLKEFVDDGYEKGLRIAVFIEPEKLWNG